jgi:hypothetical protein
VLWWPCQCHHDMCCVQVLFWDTTAGNKPVSSIKAAHGTGPDVHCVDWSGLQEHLVVTGGAACTGRGAKLLPCSSAVSTCTAARPSCISSAAVAAVQCSHTTPLLFPWCGLDMSCGIN